MTVDFTKDVVLDMLNESETGNDILNILDSIVSEQINSENEVPSV